MVHRSIVSVQTSAFEHQVKLGCRVSPASSQRSLTGDLNRGIDGVFEALRVVGRGLVSVAAAHAKVAGAHLAQGEPEMSRDRFGFLERHGASIPCRYPFIGGSASLSLCPPRGAFFSVPHTCSFRPSGPMASAVWSRMADRAY